MPLLTGPDQIIITVRATTCEVKKGQISVELTLIWVQANVSRVKTTFESTNVDQDVRNEDEDRLSLADLKQWLSQEILDSTKALELRKTEATNLVSALERGEISQHEAVARLRKYDKRWGEALFGANAGEGITDDSILAAIDKARTGTIKTHVNRLRTPGKGADRGTT